MCQITSTIAHHNLYRDILSTMGTAFGYVTSKEVVVAPWYKKPDVELQDASGYLLIVPRSESLLRGYLQKCQEVEGNVMYPRKDT